MQARRNLTLCLALGLAVVALGFFLSSTHHRRVAAVPTVDTRKAEVPVAPSHANTNGVPALQRIIGAFRQSPSSDAARKLGPELKAYLDTLPRQTAVGELQQLLD